MIVVDTCIWIGFLKGSEPVFSELQSLLENGEVLANELVFAELMQGAKNKREREIISGYWEYLPKLQINGLIIRAGQESALNGWLNKGVGLIDSAILVYTRESGSVLWTIDKKLLGLLKVDERYK